MGVFITTQSPIISAIAKIDQPYERWIAVGRVFLNVLTWFIPRRMKIKMADHDETDKYSPSCCPWQHKPIQTDSNPSIVLFGLFIFRIRRTIP